MITMQYRFVLPSDYDMGIVERRIAEKGPALDDFQGLAFKAYLYARAGEDGPENLYAPFYLWQEDAAMSRFVTGPGFEAVSGAFGWPAIRTWLPWHTHVADDVRTARFATRELWDIEPHADLADVHARAGGLVDKDALASVVGFEPTGWSQIHFRLWAERPEIAGAETYRVGHVSRPKA